MNKKTRTSIRAKRNAPGNLQSDAARNMPEGDTKYEHSIDGYALQALLELCPYKQLPMVALLYLFYKKVSFNQKTEQVWATDAYCMEGLKWTKYWFRPAKRFLKEVGLIEIVHKKRTKNNKYATYTKVNNSISAEAWNDYKKIMEEEREHKKDGKQPIGMENNLAGKQPHFELENSPLSAKDLEINAKSLECSKSFRIRHSAPASSSDKNTGLDSVEMENPSSQQDTTTSKKQEHKQEQKKVQSVNTSRKQEQEQEQVQSDNSPIPEKLPPQMKELIQGMRAQNFNKTEMAPIMAALKHAPSSYRTSSEFLQLVLTYLVDLRMDTRTGKQKFLRPSTMNMILQNLKPAPSVEEATACLEMAIQAQWSVRFKFEWYTNAKKQNNNFQNNKYSSKGTGPSSSNMNYRDETVMAMLEEADKLSRPIPMENDPPRPKSEPKPIKQITITRTPVKKSDFYAVYGNANYQIHPNGNGTQVHPCGNQNGNQNKNQNGSSRGVLSVDDV